MAAPRRRHEPAETPPAETVIVDAEIGCGHDGRAELVVSLRWSNGHVSKVVLDTEAGLRLMRNCGVAHLSELAGHSWRKILEESKCST